MGAARVLRRGGGHRRGSDAAYRRAVAVAADADAVAVADVGLSMGWAHRR